MFKNSIMKKISFQSEDINFKYITKKHSFSKHIHEQNFMIGTFLEGYSTFTLETSKYTVSKDTICIIPPFYVHTCNSFELLNSWEFVNFFPSYDFLLHLAKSFDTNIKNFYFPILFIEDKMLCKYLKHIIFHALHNRACEDEMVQFLMTLLKKHGKFNKNQRNTTKKEKFDKLFYFLKHEQYDLKELDFYKLAKIMDMNPFYFHRLFSKNIGLTPANFINCLRITKATNLFAKNTNLCEIALDSGFYDQPYFTKQFKKYHGITPTNYVC